MLTTNRFGILISRPWRRSKRVVRFASLTPPNSEGQQRAYDSSPKLRGTIPVVAVVRREVWT